MTESGPSDWMKSKPVPKCSADDLIEVLADHDVFGLEASKRLAAARELAHWWTPAECDLVFRYARASGRRKLEKLLHDLDRDAPMLPRNQCPYAHALRSAAAWEAKAKPEDCEARPGHYEAPLREMLAARMTHDDRLRYLQQYGAEWSPDSAEQVANRLGVTIDELAALLEEAGAELSFDG